MWKWLLSWFKTDSKASQDKEIEDDPIVGELLNRVWTTGKMTVANRDENGVVTFEELE